MEKTKERPQRTLKQNRALHKWFKESADLLNSSGADMQVVLSKRLSIWWSEGSFKESLFKPVMEKVYNKKSTTELNTKETTELVDMLRDAIALSNGVELPEFPSVESLMNQQRGRRVK